MDPREFEEMTGGNLLFKVLDEQAREDVMRLGRKVRYPQGTVIIRQDADDEDIFLLCQGTVDVQTTQEGFIVELNTLKPGTVFGEVAEVSNVRRTATVVANEEVELLRFDGPALVEMLRRHPTASKLLDHIVVSRARDTIRKTFGD